MIIMVVPYRDLKVHKLLSKGRHFVIEAELVLSNTLSRKDKIALSLLRSLQDHLVTGPGHGVINIEGAARLNLSQENAPSESKPRRKILYHLNPYSKIESHLRVSLLNVVVEAGLLVSLEPVGESGRRHSRHQRGQKADDQGCEMHRDWRKYGRAGSSIWGISPGVTVTVGSTRPLEMEVKFWPACNLPRCLSCLHHHQK